MRDILFEAENVRLNATIRISVKNNETGERYKIELVRLLSPSRNIMLRFDGRDFAKVYEASFTQVCARMRKLLIIMTKQKF